MEYLELLAIDSMLEHLEHMLDILSLLTGLTGGTMVDNVTAVSHFLRGSRSRGIAVTDLADDGTLRTSWEFNAVVDEDLLLLSVAMETRFFRLGITNFLATSTSSSSSSGSAPYPPYQLRATTARRDCSSLSHEARRDLDLRTDDAAAAAATPRLPPPSPAATTAAATSAQELAAIPTRPCNTTPPPYIREAYAVHSCCNDYLIL